MCSVLSLEIRSIRYAIAGEKNMVGAGEEGIEEKFSMSAVDLSMIQHLPDLIEAGVDSLKIEGRMKSIHYVSTVSNVYRAASRILTAKIQITMYVNKNGLTSYGKQRNVS